MYNYFECKVKYEKLDDNGVNKTVAEAYLVDALSCADAENRIVKEMKPYISGEFSVEGVKRVKISELFGVEDDGKENRWYKSKINFITLDEEKSIEKRKACMMYVKADDIESALKKVKEGMKNTLVNHEIVSIIETAIIDYYPYEEQQEGTSFYDEDE